MKKTNYTFHFGFLLCTFWMAYASISAFASYYLLDLGVSNTVIGLVIAFGFIVSTLIEPPLAAWADHPSSPPFGKILFVLMLISIALTAGFMVFRNISSTVCCILFGCTLVSMAVVQPILNVLGMETVNQKKPINYGLSRAIGSCGYGVMAYLMGVITEHAGAVSVPIAAILATGASCVLALLYPLKRSTAVSELAKQTPQRESSLSEFVKRYPRLMLFLVGMLLCYVSHMLLNNYTLQIVVSKGGSTEQMGLATALAVCFEMIPMLLFGILTKHTKTHHLLIVCGFAYFLKNLASLLVQTLPGFYAAQTFQLCAWGFSTLFLVVYINQVVSHEDAVKGQAFASIAYTAGAAISSLVGGRLLDSAGVDAMLLFGTVLSGIGAFIMLFTVQKTPDVKKA